MIAAVVILHHPNHDLLNTLFQQLESQVSIIYAVDNTPDISIATITFQSKKVRYMPMGLNLGIAKAQNIGISQAIVDRCTHVVLFDQDSIPPKDMIPDLLRTEQQLQMAGKKVAAVGPLYHDRVKNVYSAAIQLGLIKVKYVTATSSNKQPIESDLIVSSGALINLSVIKDVGMMLEELFIDGVDTEWCMRAKAKGYQPFIAPTSIMSHALGDAYISIIGKKITLHSHQRNYYYIRNICFMLTQKNPVLGWKIQHGIKVPFYVIVYSWCSSSSLKQRCKNFLSLLHAVKNGISNQLGPTHHLNF